MVALAIVALCLPSIAEARPPGPKDSLLERTERVIDGMSLEAGVESAV